MTAYAKRAPDYLKWKPLPQTKRSRVDDATVQNILDQLMNKPGQYAEISSTVAYRLKDRGVDIRKRSTTVIKNGQPVKVLEVYAAWIPAT